MSEATPACSRVTAAWDHIVGEFLDGGPAAPAALSDWAAAYAGRGRGEVVLDAFPEPYLGSLHGQPKAVFLALNPGRAYLDFQSRAGIFAQEIESLGSYGSWAATWPYLRDPWVSRVGPNLHHRSRLGFLRRWFDDALGPEAMVGFELYPWHSTGVTALMRPDPAILREWVWDPIAELAAPVFAFGKPWSELLGKDPDFSLVDHLGRHGRPYDSAVASRSVQIYRNDRNVTVLVEWHSGSAAPPNAAETALLKHHTGKWLDHPA